VPKVSYVLINGTKRCVEVPVGKTVMRAAVDNKIEGIVAMCGGECACGTCHVYVDFDFLPLLPPLTEDEDAMLGCVAAERKDNSRLSCQIKITDALDGITVMMPPTQSLE